MRFSIRFVFITTLICSLGFLFQSPSLLAGQKHVVSPAELQQATLSVARARQRNVAKVEKLFSSPRAQKALKSVHVDPVQIQQAVSSLSDRELAQLASKANKAQENFAAGALTNQQITYILIALATAVVVLIATH